MKKISLLAAVVLFSTAAFSQTVTKVSPDGSDNPFKLPANSHVYAIFKMNDGMKAALGIDDSHYTYIGEDSDQGRNLWNWQSTASQPGGPQPPQAYKNSFGQPAQLYHMAGASGWSGWGLNVAKSAPIDLSTMFDPLSDDADKYGFHFAVRQTHRSKGTTPTISITDGAGHTAEFKFGTGKGQINVPADGNWYSIDISCFDLLDLYGVDFSTSANKRYSDKNLFTFTWGGAPDDMFIDFATFFYGPGSTSTGIKEITNSDKTVSDAPIYNLSGQRVSSPSHGIYIQNGKKYIHK